MYPYFHSHGVFIYTNFPDNWWIIYIPFLMIGKGFNWVSLTFPVSPDLNKPWKNPPQNLKLKQLCHFFSVLSIIIILIMYIFVCHFSIQDRAHSPLQVSIYIHTINPENRHQTDGETAGSYLGQRFHDFHRVQPSGSQPLLFLLLSQHQRIHVHVSVLSHVPSNAVFTKCGPCLTLTVLWSPVQLAGL